MSWLDDINGFNAYSGFSGFYDFYGFYDLEILVEQRDYKIYWKHSAVSCPRLSIISMGEPREHLTATIAKMPSEAGTMQTAYVQNYSNIFVKRKV